MRPRDWTIAQVARGAVDALELHREAVLWGLLGDDAQRVSVRPRTSDVVLQGPRETLRILARRLLERRQAVNNATTRADGVRVLPGAQRRAYRAVALKLQHAIAVDEELERTRPDRVKAFLEGGR